MSACLRPVIEQWGESYSYSRDLDYPDPAELLQRIAASINIETRENNYDDLIVVWIEYGAAFLDHVAQGVDHACATLGILPDDTITLPQRTFITDLSAMAPAWRRSIDPADGSLRFYID